VYIGGELDLRNGEVSNNEIGICLESDEYDTNRLRDGVDYFDNRANLDAVSLPVPDRPMVVGGEPAD
jgi:hypothetical protein